MHLVQLLLPLFRESGVKVPDATFAGVRRELMERFGGVTAYSQAPATGLWQDGDGNAERDAVILVEVVVPAFDRCWWASYKDVLKRDFGQTDIHLRAMEIDLI